MGDMISIVIPTRISSSIALHAGLRIAGGHACGRITRVISEFVLLGLAEFVFALCRLPDGGCVDLVVGRRDDWHAATAVGGSGRRFIIFVM